jgi:hypothetical protein
MFLNIPKTKQAAILCIKIQEIDMSDEYTDGDKAQMMAFYRKKLKNIQPKRKF